MAYVIVDKAMVDRRWICVVNIIFPYDSIKKSW